MTADARHQSDVPPDQAATTIGAAHDRPVEYSPGDWPHFDRGFAKYERLVGSARSHLFPRCARRMERAGQHRLLVNGLVAPTTAIDSATAAAFGWAISWLSPAQVLAPETGFFTPACGLVAWLARIPLRPLSTHPQTWNERVARWLLDDLCLSAKLWGCMAAFMSTRRFYLLYGEAVSPSALALRHAKDGL